MGTKGNMETSLSVELGNGLKFAVKHEVKSLADFRKLLQKADKKIAESVKVLPELADEKIARAKVSGEQVKTAPAAA